MGILTGSDDLAQEDWDKAYWGINPAAIEFLRATNILTRPRRILEIGCGKGYMLRYLAERGHDVTGIDMDDAALAECNAGLAVRRASAADLPFDDDSFDLVISFDLFEHVPETDDHLREVRRVLRSEGHYLIGTPNKWTNVPFETLRCTRKFGIRHAFDFLKPPEHCALHSYGQLRRRLRAHGFSSNFHDIPVVNEFFKQKLQRFAGSLGLLALKLVNPDRLPMPLRTNFFVDAKRLG
jgi:SAM-dependent methyltransferase